MYNLKKIGVGMGAGDSYDVTVSQISNQVLWRILYRGYMGSSYSDWNLECDDDLYYATKVAVHSMAEGVAPNQKYEVATRVGKFDQGLSLEEVQRRSRKVLDVAEQLYDYGYNGSENYMKATVSVSEQGNLIEETINGIEYIIQNYNISANKELSSYKVSISKFPDGTKIFNKNNNETQQMTNSSFKIAIPKSNIQGNIEGYINITEAQVKTYPIFYADSLDENSQNYVTFADPSESSSTSKKLNINANKSVLKIVKNDGENNKPISGVTFEIKYIDGTTIGDYTTNENGIIEINNLKPGKILIKEKSAPDKYIIDSTVINDVLKFNATTTVYVNNMHKKGNLVIHKVDADNNSIPLENVSFKVYDDKNNYIKTIVTDKNGEARLNNINTGTYTLIEESTNEFYILDTEKKTIKINWSEQKGDSEIVLTNQKKTGFIEVYKYDTDAMERHNKFLGVSDVVFGIFDMQGNKIQEVTTNKDGYAKSGELPLIKEQYIVRELKTRPEYITNEKSFTVNLIENGINDGCVYTLRVGNEHKKGNLFVEKIMMDDNTIAMGNIEFELYLVGNNTTDPKLYIGTYYTDANRRNLYRGVKYRKLYVEGGFYK